jgi:hypothetical protein
MDIINRQIKRAANLLWTRTILNVLAWCLIIAFSICFIGLLVPKIVFLPYTFQDWSKRWFAISGIVVAVVTFAVAMIYRPTRLHSAIELDRRFGLRERISSAIQLDATEVASPVGSALVQDAQTKAERLDVRDQFPVRFAAQTPWVMLPLLACISLFWVPDAEMPAIKKLAGNNAERLNNIKNQIKPILAQIKKQREAKEEKGLQEAADEFKRIEKKLEELQKTTTLDTKKLLSDFNEIKKEVEQRKEALGGSDNLKKALDGLKQIDKGPADKVADALKDGDFDKASKELEKMLEQMKNGKMTDEQKKQLTKQLEQMQKAIEKSSAEDKKAMEETQKELEKATKAGDAMAASKLQKKLDQMQAQAKKGKVAEAVKAKMEQAQKAMEEGNEDGAKKALEELADELGDMADDQEALQEMEDLAAELQNAKKASACDKCNGNGCQACNGKSDKEGKETKDAKGEGKGRGDREEEETGTKYFDSQVRDQMKKGETSFGGKVGGANRKGVTKEEVRDSVLNSTPDDPDAIENMTLPKAQRDQQRDYFNSLRDK